MKRVLYIGRFNPLHNGHLKAIEYIFKAENNVDQIIIGIGTAQESYTLQNPFTSGERFEFLLQALNDLKIPCNRYLIVPIPDLNNNNLWISYLKALLPKFDYIYSNNSLVNLLAEGDESISIKPIPLINRQDWSATVIRQKIINNDESWKELVPKSVKEIILHLNGVKRIQLLAKNDA